MDKILLIQEKLNQDILIVPSIFKNTLDTNIFIANPKESIISFITEYQELKDTLFINSMIKNKIFDLDVYQSVDNNEYRIGYQAINWSEHKLNIEKHGIGFLKQLYKKQLIGPITNQKSNFYYNDNEDILYTLYSGIPSVGLFGSKKGRQVAQFSVNLMNPKKNYNRSYIIVFDSDNTGHIYLNFLFRHRDNFCYFNNQQKISDILISEFNIPYSLLMRTVNKITHSVLQIKIPFTINNTVKFNDFLFRYTPNALILEPTEKAKFSPLTSENIYLNDGFEKEFFKLEKEYKLNFGYPTSFLKLEYFLKNIEIIRY